MYNFGMKDVKSVQVNLINNCINILDEALRLARIE